MQIWTEEQANDLVEQNLQPPEQDEFHLVEKDLKVELQNLAAQRQDLSALCTKEQELFAIIEKMPIYGQYKTVAGKRLNLKGEVAKIEEGVRALLIKLWNVGPKDTKTLTGGAIRMKKKLEIVDRKAAVEFLMINRPDAITIDEKAAIEAAKGLDCAWARVYEEPEGAIKSDLSAFLPKE